MSAPFGVEARCERASISSGKSATRTSRIRSWRASLSRAALAHGGIVAERLELALRLSDGVELLRVLPATQLRHGGHGVKTAIGDVFVDEFRLIALELAVDLPPSARVSSRS